MRGAASRALLVLVLVVAGCSGDDGVEPKAWAKEVCQALKPWQSEITARISQAQQQLGAANQSPEQTKSAVVGLLSDAAGASEAARRKVEQAGVPDVDDGKRIAEQFVTALAGARDSYGRAADAVRQLATADAKAFYDGVQAVMDQLQQEYQRTGLDTSTIRSEELQKAFDEVPECR